MFPGGGQKGASYIGEGPKLGLPTMLEGSSGAHRK